MKLIPWGVLAFAGCFFAGLLIVGLVDQARFSRLNADASAARAAATDAAAKLAALETESAHSRASASAEADRLRKELAAERLRLERLAESSEAVSQNSRKLERLIRESATHDPMGKGAGDVVDALQGYFTDPSFKERQLEEGIRFWEAVCQTDGVERIVIWGRGHRENWNGLLLTCRRFSDRELDLETAAFAVHIARVFCADWPRRDAENWIQWAARATRGAPDGSLVVARKGNVEVRLMDVQRNNTYMLAVERRRQTVDEVLSP